MAQVSIQQTVMAIPTWTAVPTFTPEPELPTPDGKGGQKTEGCNSFTFLPGSVDVTIPDGTSVAAGQQFTKTWRIRNAGTCNWNANYGLSFSTGDRMAGPSFVKLGRAVKPGEQIDISVKLTAPKNVGTYKGAWAMQTSDGEFFGTFLTVSIHVIIPPTPTRTATPCPFPPKFCK